jgi:hypothetical protein
MPTGDIQGMTEPAMVIDAHCVPARIRLAHTQDDAFDRASIAAVKHSLFEPGTLACEPAPMGIGVRSVFRARRSRTVPEIPFTGREPSSPDAAQLQSARYRPRHVAIEMRRPCADKSRI